MDKSIRVALVQADFVVGAVAENAARILDFVNCARDQHNAQLVVFPELTLSGYLAEDWYSRADFAQLCSQQCMLLVAQIHGIDVLFGCPVWKGEKCFNQLLWVRNGEIIAVYTKQKLPNSGVFDEQRYFESGHNTVVVNCHGLLVAPLICEDIWHDQPIAQARMHGAEFVIVANASPFDIDKHGARLRKLQYQAQTHQLPILYVNLVGGQDDILFDGQSCMINAQGNCIAQAPAFVEDIFCVNLALPAQVMEVPVWHCKTNDPVALVYHGLVRALRDYVHKNNFTRILLGLSGGIDSALTLVLAVDALGAKQVTAVMMPSKFTSQLSLDLARTQTELLSVRYQMLSVEDAWQTMSSLVSEVCESALSNLTQENLQARTRGMLLMALSNQSGDLLLSTSNKSEVAMGYSTLYGDMCGGFAPLKDCYKTMVYKLALYRNMQSEVIPSGVITRTPTAELHENQTDQDSLPAYDILDAILTGIIEQKQSLVELVNAGFNEDTVLRVMRLLRCQEY